MDAGGVWAEQNAAGSWLGCTPAFPHFRNDPGASRWALELWREVRRQKGSRISRGKDRAVEAEPLQLQGVSAAG